MMPLPVASKRFDDSNLIPLINVVFLMLIFFMVAGQIAARSPIDIEEPVSVSEALLKIEAVELYVNSELVAYLEGEIVDLEEQGPALKDLEVRLGVDQSLSAEQLVPILIALKGYGVSSLTLRTQVARGK